ncbi:MAG: sigma 54-interacting transcriptional regulator [Polyangiaceae bacterium]
MSSQETSAIAVCASGPADLEALVQAVRGAGSWSIVPIEWPNPQALNAALEMAEAFLLHSGEAVAAAPSAELVNLLGGRPEGSPLIVVGVEPSRRAAPTCWLPSLPNATVLGAILNELVTGARANGIRASLPPMSRSWRRKTDMILGSSPAITQVLHALDQLAPAQTPVIITGDSGVGKELVARALHYCGPRAKEPFIAINCAAIPETLFEAELFGYQRGAFTGAVAAHAGAFEAAGKGTLFLDELGEMPLAMQAKLLRVLQEREIERVGGNEVLKVDVRVVAATNRDLVAASEKNEFRADLYDRLNVVPLVIPPLRARREDVPLLARHFLELAARANDRREMKLSDGAVALLTSYSFPGNVRELRNLMERLVILTADDLIDEADVATCLPGGAAPQAAGLYRPGVPFRVLVEEAERTILKEALLHHGGQMTATARALDLERSHLYKKARALGLRGDKSDDDD